MARSVRINDRMPSFRRSLYNVLDDAIREAGKDTLIKARQNAPFDTGALRRESDVKKMRPLYQRVRFWVEYARFQEFGGDAKRRVRHYSTAGTGAHFLRNAGDEMTDKLKYTLRKHSRRAK